MFGRLLSALFGKSRSDHTSFKKAISIDVTGPEFYDLYPTRDQWRSAVASTGAFAPDAVEWVSKALEKASRGGSSYKGALEAVTRAGDPASPDRLRSFGFTARKKLGERFLSSLAHNRGAEAIEALEGAIQVTQSNQNKIHDLRRIREAGITHVVFRSARDERNTALESQLEGKRMTIDEALQLVKTRGPEITRSCFAAKVSF